MLIRNSIRVLVLAMTIVTANAYGAADEAPAPGPAATPAKPVELPQWMSADVVKAAVAINMTDAQTHQFNEIVGQYVTEHFAMVEKEVKKEAPDLDQRVRSRDNALAHQMDEGVKTVLSKEQLLAYEAYKKVLRDQLKSAPLPQQRGGTRAQPGVGGGRG